MTSGTTQPTRGAKQKPWDEWDEWDEWDGWDGSV